jgi:hypothetical protein
MIDAGIIVWIVSVIIGCFAAYPLNMKRYLVVMIALLIARISGGL